MNLHKLLFQLTSVFFVCHCAGESNFPSNPHPDKDQRVPDSAVADFPHPNDLNPDIKDSAADKSPAHDWLNEGLPHDQAPPQDKSTPDQGTGCTSIETLYKGHCYSAPGFKNMSYATGKEICSGLGAKITTITSSEEGQFVFKLLPPSTQGAWIGLTRTGPNPNDFKWESNEVVSYLNWATGEPNNENSIENCVLIWGPAISVPELGGKWNDAPCNTPGRDTVICERQP